MTVSPTSCWCELAGLHLLSALSICSLGHSMPGRFFRCQFPLRVCPFHGEVTWVVCRELSSASIAVDTFDPCEDLLFPMLKEGYVCRQGSISTQDADAP